MCVCTTKQTCVAHDYRWSTPNATNIIAVFRQATVQELEHGANWYSDGAKIAVAIGGTVERGAGVIAALSPQEGWASNINLAARAFADGAASGHTSLYCSRADAIIAGADPATVLGGPKVRSFYASFLVAAGLPSYDTSPVCVDRHAVAIACGHTLSDFDRKVLERKGAYEMVAAAYRLAARILDIPAHVLQATTWVTWRRIHGIVDANTEIEEF